VSAADMAQAGPADMTEASGANVTAAKMHAAEMTAATEVATATVAAAATAAGKGVRREAQRANGDARQEHSCCLGHHGFSPDIGRRVSARTAYVHARSPEFMSVPGNDFSRIAVPDTSLRQYRRRVGSGQRRDLSDPDRKYGELQPMVGNPALAMSKGIHSSSTDAGSDRAFP
jgi:hypothetical protein